MDALNRRIATSLGFFPKGWYAGRPVMVTRNDYNLKLMNGDVGLVLPDRAVAVLTREPLYTGLTRAKARLTFVGTGVRHIVTVVGVKVFRNSGLKCHRRKPR